jgi:hypothetical protein
MPTLTKTPPKKPTTVPMAEPIVSEARIAPTSNPNIIQMTLENERYYHIQEVDRYLPSVTWINESYPKGIGFYKWLAANANWDEAQATKETAGDRGSKIHNAIQDLLNGASLKFGDAYWNETKQTHEPLTMDEWKCLMAFQSFWDEYEPEIIATERVCYSLKHGYAGTIDALLKIGKDIVVVDWKTSSAIYSTYLMQVGAYMIAETETGEFKPTATAVVRLGSRHKKGYEIQLFNKKESKENFKNFLNVKKIWAIENGNKKPEIVSIPSIITLNIGEN